MTALDYQLLHVEFGHYLGRQVNRFIEENGLHYQVALVASHGHTSFHMPAKGLTAQLGDGAAIAAETGLPVVSDLRALDVALGGQGAPIVPFGEKHLLSSYNYFLNIGGIANVSFNGDPYIAFDVCPANRVLNLLAQQAGKAFDEGGALAAAGTVHPALLDQLNTQPYYQQPPPKSLANEFGTDTLYPMIRAAGLPVADALATYCEHMAIQLRKVLETSGTGAGELLCTGGGAFNRFLVSRLQAQLEPLGITVVVPDEALVNYKEALIMAFIGVLRWRQSHNTLASVTGARRDSIGGALWTGQED
jgi:anhydro-N-acetylmuramic acid kinase